MVFTAFCKCILGFAQVSDMQEILHIRPQQIPKIIDGNADIEKDGKAKNNSKERRINNTNSEDHALEKKRRKKHENKGGDVRDHPRSHHMHLAFFISESEERETNGDKKNTDDKKKIIEISSLNGTQDTGEIGVRHESKNKHQKIFYEILSNMGTGGHMVGVRSRESIAKNM